MAVLSGYSNAAARLVDGDALESSYNPRRSFLSVCVGVCRQPFSTMAATSSEEKIVIIAIDGSDQAKHAFECK